MPISTWYGSWVFGSVQIGAWCDETNESLLRREDLQFAWSVRYYDRVLGFLVIYIQIEEISITST